MSTTIRYCHFCASVLRPLAFFPSNILHRRALERLTYVDGKCLTSVNGRISQVCKSVDPFFSFYQFPCLLVIYNYTILFCYISCILDPNKQILVIIQTGIIASTSHDCVVLSYKLDQEAWTLKNQGGGEVLTRGSRNLLLHINHKKSINCELFFVINTERVPTHGRR